MKSGGDGGRDSASVECMLSITPTEEEEEEPQRRLSAGSHNNPPASACSASASSSQGLTLVHFSAQRKRFLWDRVCSEEPYRGCVGGVTGY